MLEVDVNRLCHGLCVHHSHVLLKRNMGNDSAGAGKAVHHVGDIACTTRRRAPCAMAAGPTGQGGHVNCWWV